MAGGHRRRCKPYIYDTEMPGDENRTIECRCGRCGRVIGVSDRELRAHGGVVVCPVCLNHVSVEGYEPDDAAVSPQPSLSSGFRYCFGCGERLPREINARYCPYCGVRLDGSEPLPAPTAPQPVAVEQPAAAPAPESKAGGAATQAPEPQQSTIAFLPSSFIPAWMDNEPQKRASLRFHIFAGLIIAALLVTLGLTLNAIAALP